MIEKIIKNKESENYHLEYKNYTFNNGEFKISDKDLEQLFKSIVAFANAEGGIIIIGVEESNDGSHNVAGIRDVGVTKEQMEKWEQAFRNKLSDTIVPRLNKVKVEHYVYEDKNIISVSVPRGFNKPYAVIKKSGYTYYLRMGNTSRAMHYDEIKRAFEAGLYKEARIFDFREQRLHMLLNGDLVGTLGDRTALVIHIIPEVSVDVDSYVDLSKIKESKLFTPPCIYKAVRNKDPYRLRFNSDGIVVDDCHGGQVQIFNNGILEAIDFYTVNQEKYTFDGATSFVESVISESIHRYERFLRTLNINGTYYVLVSFVNAKGKVYSFGAYDDFDKQPIKNNIIKCTPTKVNDNDKFSDVMYPLLNSFAHIFGWRRSHAYNEDGSENEIFWADLNKYIWDLDLFSY